jgi:hypothetical protein
MASTSLSALTHLDSRLRSARMPCVRLPPPMRSTTMPTLPRCRSGAGYLEGKSERRTASRRHQVLGVPRIVPSEQETTHWVFFFLENREYKDYAALDFVFDELNLLLRSEGEARAQIERNVLMERAVARGIPGHNIEVAITWLVMGKQLGEKDSILHFAHRGAMVRQLPSVTRAIHRHVDSRPHKARAHPLVKDVIARRFDGRPQHPEPLDAFAEQLERLGYRQFEMWWMQTVSELRQASPCSTPVTVAVLAAALVEGTLTFVVKHARANGQFQSKEYDKDRERGR